MNFEFSFVIIQIQYSKFRIDMKILPLIIAPDPLLKQISKPVEKVDDKLREFMDDLLQTMYAVTISGTGNLCPQAPARPRRRLVCCGHYGL